MTKKIKYLVDTSAVRPALAFSTAEHCHHFLEETKDGSLWTSLYIRMEFIRCWFCELARIAFTIAHFNDVEQALYYLLDTGVWSLVSRSQTDRQFSHEASVLASRVDDKGVPT